MMNPLRPHRLEIAFYALVVLVAGSLFVGGALTGHRLLNQGYLWPPDVLFGMDAARNIDNLTKPDYNDRSNVHPFFAPFLKPVGRGIMKLGITAGMSAIMMNAAAGALSVLLTAWYLRRRRVNRLEALGAVLLMAASTTIVVESTIPGTYLFSACVIALTHILLTYSAEREQRNERPLALEAGWIVTGVWNYGLTVVNGMYSFIAYGFSRRGLRGWLAAVLYGAFVWFLGYACSLTTHAYLNVLPEKQFLLGGFGTYHPFRTLFEVLSSFLVWCFVAPTPQISWTLDGRHWQIMTFHQWEFSPTGWALVLAWCAVLIAAIIFAVKDSDRLGRRYSLALALSIAFAVVLHVFYNVSYEGPFAFSGHTQFFVVALLAPMLIRAGKLKTSLRVLILIAFIVASAILAARHFGMLCHVAQIVPLPSKW